MSACIKCGTEDDDLRMGFCFDCATKGEGRAAKRTALQHIAKGCDEFRRRRFWQGRICFRWAWERLTRTGDYKRGGYFDREGHDWR